MPTDLVETATFTDPIAVPVDADPANAASVETPFQGLANRTRWMVDVVARSAQGILWDLGTWTFSTGGHLSTADGEFIWLHAPPLPPGAEITSVDVNVDPGAARSSGSRMEVRLQSQAAATGAVTTHVTQEDTINTTVPHLITATPGAPLAVDDATLRYFVAIESGTDGAHVPDRMISVVWHYTAPRVGT